MIAQSVLGVETFNTLYKKYCEEEFGGKNGKNVIDQLEEQINGYKNVNPDCKIVYHLFDPDMSDVLIIAIVTPLMKRIHNEVLV